MQTAASSFRSYRAIYKIHVGGLERDILKDEVVHFDGTSMKVGDKSVEAPTLTAAIKVGWLVPLDQAGTTEYKPAPASVQMHKAASTTPDRKPIEKVVVHDEERDVGHLSRIRGEKAPDTHTAKNAGMTHKTANENGPAGTESDGVVIGRLKTPTNFGKLEVGKDDQRVLRDLDPLTGRKLETLVVRTATGDVKEPRIGDTLDDLLPDAASSSVPEPGTTDPDTRARNYRDTDARAKTAVGSSSVGGMDDGVVIGKVGAVKAVVAEAPAPEKQEEATVVDEVPPEAIVQAKIEMIQQFVPGFSWDMKENWMVRAKTALDKYKGNMPVLNAILSIETPPVRKRIMKALYGE
jgi:hypothetical protein